MVATSLPILDQIAEMERTAKLSPEAAELFKRKIIGGACKFLETGSTIPEIDAKAHVDPAKLLQAKETLLLEAPKASPASVQPNSDSSRASGNEPDGNDQSDDAISDAANGADGLTPGEVAEALREARRRKGGK